MQDKSSLLIFSRPIRGTLFQFIRKRDGPTGPPLQSLALTNQYFSSFMRLWFCNAWPATLAYSIYQYFKG